MLYVSTPYPHGLGVETYDISDYIALAFNWRIFLQFPCERTTAKVAVYDPL